MAKRCSDVSESSGSRDVRVKTEASVPVRCKAEVTEAPVQAAVPLVACRQELGEKQVVKSELKR